MNVEDFVSESITQIVRGVEKAKKECAGHGAHVTPIGYTGDRSVLQLIEFNVAVTVQTSVQGTAGGKGKAGIK